MVAYKKPQQWKKEENERPRGERDQIKAIKLEGKPGIELGTSQYSVRRLIALLFVFSNATRIPMQLFLVQ